MTDADFDIIHSPLEQKIERDGITVEVFIYRASDTDGWILEVQDHKGGSTVWDDQFPTDREAYEEAIRAINEDGIASFAEAVAINLPM